jgi:hypothetical protein
MTKIKFWLPSMIMLQIAAIVTPAFSQEGTQVSGAYASSRPKADLESESAPSRPRKVIVVDRDTADAMASVSTGRPWTPGN